MQWVKSALLIACVLLVAVIAGWSQSHAQESDAGGPIQVEPPADWLERVVSVDELTPVAGDPRVATAGAAADTCVDATSLNLSFTFPADGGATLTNPYTEQENDPILSCMWGNPPNLRGYRTVWYKYLASDTAEVTITTRGTSYDTVLAVYSGNCENLRQMACSDDYISLQSQITFQTVRNETYFIEVADWHSAVTPQANLALSAVMDGRETRWAQVGNIPEGGVSRHAIATQGSQIYLIGGQQNLFAFPALTNQLQRYDASTGQWSGVSLPALADMPTAYANTTAVQVGGKIYVPGGFNGNTSAYDATHWTYTISTDLWSTSPSIPANLLPAGGPFAWSQAVADPSGQSFFLVGGLSTQPPIDPAASVSAETYRFTPATGAWQKLTPMPAPRYAHTAAWVSPFNKGLCVAGGLSTGVDSEDTPITVLLTNAVCYNPNQGGGWVPTERMNFPRYNAASAIGPDGNWYVFGGMDEAGPVAETEVYDPVTNSWQLLDSSFSLGGRPNDPARVWPVGAFVGNDLWVFGGNDFPERRVISSYKRITMPSNQVALANRILLPFATSGGGTNFLDFASPIALGTTVTGNFSQSVQFYNPYFFDWFVNGRASIRLTNIPSSSNFNVLVYDSQKRLLGQGSSVVSKPEKWVDLTLAPGRYYILIERIFPNALPNPNDFYSLYLTQY